MLELENVFYFWHINVIGGIETFFYEMVKKYSDDHDITIVYRTGDEEQIRRLKKYVRVKKYNGEPLSIENYITLHHLIKKEHKGATSIKNGALLSKIMHEYLHYIECWYIGHYHYINDYLRYYKETEDPSEKDKMNCYIKKLIKINRKV